MNKRSETDRGKIGAFVDWVNADSADIPEEIAYEHKEHHGDHHHEEHHSEESAEAQIQKEIKLAFSVYRVVSLICGLFLVLILLFTVNSLPLFGDRNVPALNEVSQRYLEDGLTETGAVNVVAGIILDYRAFDTLGESMVLFTGSIAVIFLLTQVFTKKSEQDNSSKFVESLPAQVIIRMIFPVIMLYGIYVIFNGHLSPGGGFSGGTILGASLILIHLAFGESYTSRFITVKRCTGIMSLALLSYIGMKTYSILTGANHIESGIPLGTPGSIFSSGLIFPLNICVGLVVACTIFAVYSLFTNWKA